MVLYSTEAVTRRCSAKKVFLKITRDSQEKQQRLSFFFNKDGGLKPATLRKKDPERLCFDVNFAKPLRTPFLQNNFE